MTLCTIFNAGIGFNKFPVSPTDDNKFTFKNLKLSTNIDFYRTMVNNFILNIPLEKLTQATETFRRKVNLIDYYPQNVNYFIIDIDEVGSKSHQNKVLEFFKDYKVILGESGDYNGVDNFNMIGVMFVNPVLVSEFKYAMCALNEQVIEHCIINPSASRMSTYTAPIQKENVIINNEDGKLYTFDRSIVRTQVNVIKESYEYSKVFMAENDATTRLKTSLNREFVDIIKDETKFYDSIEDLALSVFATMGFEYIGDNESGALVFQHHSELKSKGGYFWFKHAPYTMNHFNILKTVNIFSVVKQLPQAKSLLDLKLDYDELLDSGNIGNVGKIIIKDEKYLTVTPDIHEAIGEFLYSRDCNLMKIESAMGTGKSTIINHVIDEAHHDDLAILIITNRISVAHDFNKKYNMKIYDKDAYHIGDSLICQYDSLWKYDIRHFDIVIMDEFISVLLHSRSSMNNSAMNTNKFFKSFNKKVLIADAFLTGYEDQFFKSKNLDKTITIRNNYRDDVELFSYEDSNFFTQMILQTAKEEQITISSTSTTFIKSLESMLYNNGIRVTTLTSETSQFSKNIIYGSFAQDENDLFDVLIYSPTLTVGISNLNNIGKHFHYDSSRSTDVISSLQMIKRTRKAEEVHYYVKDTKKYLPLTYSVLRDDYINRIGKNIDQNHLFEYDMYGNPNISELGKMSVLIDVYKNVIEYSHKLAFEHLLKLHFANPQTIVTDKYQDNILTRYKRRLRVNATESDEMALKQYLNLNNLDQLSLSIEDVGKSLKNIIKIRESVSTDDNKILEDIINLQLKDNAFTEKCFFWKLVKITQSEGNGSKFIKRLIQKSIDDNNIPHYNNLNMVVKYDEIKNCYEIKELTDNPKIKCFLKTCGFITLTPEPGCRTFGIDPNVEKYCEYVNIV